MTRRPLLPILLAVAGLVGTAMPAQARDGNGARAAVTTCTPGTTPAQRVVVFTGSMPAADDTARMAMRFDLQQRSAATGVWTRVAAPGLGRWERSRTGVAGFVFAKRVDGLAAPADYRALVRFRWIAGDGGIRTAMRLTRLCRQPDPRADLTPRALLAPTSLAPRFVVRNTGRSIAPPTQATVAVDGVARGSVTVPSLSPGQQVAVPLAGPLCTPGQAVELRVDALGTVDEAVEDDDVLRIVCPG